MVCLRYLSLSGVADRCLFFFFQAEDGIRDYKVTGVQTCALPICGILRRKATGDCRHFLLRLLQRYSRLQSRIGLNPARAAIFQLVAAGFKNIFHRSGHPKLHAPADKSSEKSFRRDAHDGVHDSVQALRFADDLRIAFESSLPELITDHHDRMCALTCVFLWKKSAAENRVHSDGVKIIRGYDAADGALGTLADAERGAGNFADE